MSEGRALRIIGWSVLGVVALGIVWVVVTGLVARAELNSARAEIRQLRKAVLVGNTQQARLLVAHIRDESNSAHALTSGPAWWVAANLPGIGAPLRTGRTIAQQSARLGDTVLPGILRLAETAPAHRSSTSSIDLGTISAAAPELHRAARTADSATRVVEGTDGSWLPVVSGARDSAVTQLRRLDGELQGADRAVRILLPMLGQNGKQRYFLGFLNEAESRGGGGIPGAFAIVTADHGKIQFERFGSDDDLRGVRGNVDLGPELTARYGPDDPTGTIQNSNLSPDFSVAARIWAAMWENKTGEHVDGAVAIDPTALSYLLNVTGPATVPGGGSVSADTVVSLTQQAQYARFPGTSAAVNTERKKYLTGIAKAVSKRLTAGGNLQALVKALTRSARERRLVVWSEQPAIQAQLRLANWAGVLGNDRGAPFTAFVVNNAAGSKLDYYLQRTMTYRRSDCRAGGSAVATLAITNAAPRTGLPPYVTTRADKAPPGARIGDNHLLVTYYASRDARILAMTVDGQKIDTVTQPEGDTVEDSVNLELPVGTTITVAVTVAEPAANGPVQVLRQPLVRPIRVNLQDRECH